MTDYCELDRLWDYHDPAESERRFREFMDQELPPELRAETLTQLARTMSLRKRFPEAHKILDEVEGLGIRGTRPEIRLRLERGRAFNSAGEPQRARPEFVGAWDLAEAIGEDALAIDAAHMIALVEDIDGQIEWNEKAMTMSRASSDPRAKRWMASLLNNLAWTYHDRGEAERALPLFEEAQKLRVVEGEPITERIARWCVARCLRSVGRVQEALAMQEQLLLDQEGKGVGYVEEELGECLLELGRADESRPYFRIAFEKLEANGELDHEPERLARLRAMG